MQFVGASTYESLYREVDTSKTSDDGKRDIRFNHDEVLAVAKWQRHLREWKARLDGEQLRQNKAKHEAGWKDVPNMEDGTDVGVNFAIVEGARSNSDVRKRIPNTTLNLRSNDNILSTLFAFHVGTLIPLLSKTLAITSYIIKIVFLSSPNSLGACYVVVTPLTRLDEYFCSLSVHCKNPHVMLHFSEVTKGNFRKCCIIFIGDFKYKKRTSLLSSRAPPSLFPS
jgi:hypothetical protein